LLSPQTVGLAGRYLKLWNPDHLRTVIEQVEATHPRQPAEMNKKVVQAHKLDRRLSQETITELVDAYKAGTSTPELCRRYQLSKGGVLKLLRDHGVEMRRRGLTDEQIELAIKLYDEGHSLTAIGNELGKAKSTVRETLRECGVVMRPAIKPRKV
jgi:DNA-binding NarL/FixJ family response regulator